MIDKKDNTEEVKSNFDKFTVTGVHNRTILDAGSNPVDGIIIYFVTARGISGNVELPYKGYTKEKGTELIRKKAQDLDSLMG
jgi:hypothetical protein